ncbi:MAG: MgtC/SapB family protein [Prosthecobacter sp.]|uniref:MgtC/SapB family protein n=1 Tax=Prosthecobacter sp. TaxID=1965333 RepID=UPI0025F704BB|nr:MgtC/SapB family protein [Prosthecobacter sp.]MCF7787365.1 MgtC/SapB family protein [Prosthecobacter sp.]
MPATLPDTSELLLSLGTATGLGLLVGLQREWVQNRVAGIRTFALLTLFGALIGLLGNAYGAWAVAAGFIAFAAIVVFGGWLGLGTREPDSGMTTEMAMLVMFSTGIITMLGERLIAVMIAGGVMVLLQSKKALHAMVRHFGEDDLRAIARLVLLGLVILPALPNRAMGYLGVLNPFAIWLIVVLIVGISLAAYMAEKYLGGSKGSVLAGVLGGLVSSTATTASSARRSSTAATGSMSLAAMALIASAMAFVRLLAEVVIVASDHLRELLPPLIAMMLWVALIAAVSYRFAEKADSQPVDEHPPSELKNAVFLGLLYALVLVIVAYTREHSSSSGLYLAAFLSGLPDMSAITLSTSRLVTTGNLETSIAWRMILVGGMANLCFKMVFVIALGSRAYIKPALLGLLLSVAGGAAILALWP